MSPTDDSFTLSFEVDSEPQAEQAQNEIPASVPEPEKAPSSGATQPAGRAHFSPYDDKETPTLSGSTPVPQSASENQTSTDSTESQTSGTAGHVTEIAERMSREAATAVRELAKAMDESGPDEISSDKLAKAFGRVKNENGGEEPATTAKGTPATKSLTLPDEGNRQSSKVSGIMFVAKALREKPSEKVFIAALAILLLVCLFLYFNVSEETDNQAAIVRNHKTGAADSHGNDKGHEMLMRVKDWEGESKDELYSTKITLSTKGTAVEHFSLEVDTIADPNISAEELVKGVKKPWMRSLEFDDINVVETAGGVLAPVALDPVSSTAIHAVRGMGKVYMEYGMTKRRLLVPVTVSFNTQVDSEKLLGTWEISPPAGEAVEDTSTATFGSDGKDMLFVFYVDGKYVIQARGMFSTRYVKKAPPEETKLKSMLSAATAASKSSAAKNKKEKKAKDKGKNEKKAALAEQ